MTRARIRRLLTLGPMSRGARRAFAVLFVLLLALSAADYLAAAQKKPPAPGTFTAQFTDDISGLRRNLGC